MRIGVDLGGTKIEGVVMDERSYLIVRERVAWIRPEWDEAPGAECWCGRHGCIETWLSGVGLVRDHERVTAEHLSGEAIGQRAEAGEEPAATTLSRYEDRLARALAHVINILIRCDCAGRRRVQVEQLYRTVPTLWDQWVFSDRVDTKLMPALHGDSSGVRGAAFLCSEIQPRC